LFTASRDAGIFPDASSGLDGREDSLHEIGLKVRGVLIATSDPDKHQVETWDYVTVVVAKASTLDEITGRVLVVGVDPPLLS
jgi:hypothetical protein